MSATGPAIELIDAIRSIVDLEFFRVSSEPSTSELPLLVWRYAKKEGTERLVAEINSIIERAIQRQRVEWELRYRGRNWVLASRRFHELEDAGSFRLFPQILRHLESVDPDLARLSNIDLVEIADKVVAALRDYSRNRPQTPASSIGS
jgi:hypothetical protein